MLLLASAVWRIRDSQLNSFDVGHETELPTGGILSMPRIEIDEERCKGCELCTIPCPRSLVRMAEKFNQKGYRISEFVDPEGRCTGCAMCARMCPDVVIKVYR